MKLRTRLAILVSLIIFVSTATVGLFSIISSFNNQILTNDRIVESIIDKVAKSSDDPLSTSTYFADESTLNISVAYISPEKSFISLHINQYENNDSPGDKIIEKSAVKSQTYQQIRYRALQISNNEFLLFYYPLADIYESRNHNLRMLIIFTFFIILISVSISFLLFKNDSELNSLAIKLSENQAKMRSFIGDASHELKTPLTIIRGYFELLAEKINKSETNDSYVSRINGEIKRMQKIIDDLLFIAELEEMPVERSENSPISDMVQKEILDLSVLQSNRTITSNVEPNLFTTLSQFHLEQLLSNIFSNLLRHTPNDSRLDINLKRRSRSIELIVEDAGPGLPQHYYESGIQSFKRFDNARSRKAGGSGLGMTIMSRIVKANSGSIRISESQFGGLKIVINLPISFA